jgi:hypothetical protein
MGPPPPPTPTSPQPHPPHLSPIIPPRVLSVAKDVCRDPLLCGVGFGQVVGGDRAGLVVKRMFDRITVTLREHYGIPKDIALHLVSNYGTRALQVRMHALAARPACSALRTALSQSACLVLLGVLALWLARASHPVAALSRLPHFHPSTPPPSSPASLPTPSMDP